MKPKKAKKLSEIKFFLITLCLFVFLNNANAAIVPLKSSEIIIIFRNDDPSALSDIEHERKILDLFENYNIPQTIGVIPYVAKDYWSASKTKYASLSDNKEMVKLLKTYKQKGLIEIALHGYQHQTNNYYSYPSKTSSYYNGLSEFSKISYSDQLEKITKGKDILEGCFNEPIDIFIPPFNTYDINTLRALEAKKFKIISASLLREEIYPTGNIVNISATTNIHQLPQVIKCAQSFVKKNNSSVIIVCLYHSSEIGLNELEILKADLELIKKLEIKTATLKQLYLNYGDFLKQINKYTADFFWKHKADNFLQLMNWLHIKFPSIYNGFIILNKQLLQKQLFESKLICIINYSIFIALGLIVNRILVSKKNKRFIRFACLIPIFCLILITLLLFKEIYFGLSPGIGWKAEITLLFLISLLTGNLLIKK